MKLTNAAVIEISESKLDDSMLTSEVQIDEYDLLCFVERGMEVGLLTILGMVWVIILIIY